MFQHERNARIELFCGLLTIVLGIWLQISAIEFSIVILCIAAVLAAEAFNSALERLSDFHERGHHPEIRDLKDIAAGAVWIVALASAIVGFLIFGPKLMSLVGM